MSSSSGSSSSSSPPTCPDCDESCSQYNGASRTAQGSGGVDTFLGSIVINSSASISSNGFNVPFSTVLTYDGEGRDTSVGFGKGWRPIALTGLALQAGGEITFTPKPGGTKLFAYQTGGTYRAAYFVEDDLSTIMAGGYLLTSPDGKSRSFDIAGKLTGIANAAGEFAMVTYSGLQVASIAMGVTGLGKWEYVYAWSGGNVESIIYKVDDREVIKSEYGYDGDGYLITIKTYENSTAGTGTPVWGTPIEAARYSYHASNGLLRHVVPPTEYKQMQNNGIDPDTATSAQLDDYAETEYDYVGGGDARIAVMYTHGRRYQLGFAYSSSLHTGNRFNVWQSKTEVTRPGQVVETFYLSGAGQVLLKRFEQKSGSTVLNTWYPVYQQFESTGGARIVLSAGGSAIASFSESLPGLVTLVSTGAMIKSYDYNSEGLLSAVSLRNGTSGSNNKIREFTYVSGHVNIRPVATETVYRNEGNTGGITTSYAYSWYLSNQISSRTTTLPTVSTSENGRGSTITRVENYDSRGYLTSSIDERGSVTTYLYDQSRSGLTQKVVDQGTGKLNHTYDYTLDDRGRTVLELGPEHGFIHSGANTKGRRAKWTYYKDRDGERWDFQGYQDSPSLASVIIGPVRVTAPNIAPPSGFSGYRQSSVYEAYSSGIPLPSATFPQTTWNRWRVGLYDKAGKLTEEWTYFAIPSSGYGTQSTNYGKKLFAYDSAGRLNQTTCAGGTIDKTTYNAMGWAVTEELGTSAGLVVVEAKVYDDNGNLTKRTKPVDSTTAHDRVTDYRYDWRKRLDEEETSVEDGNGGFWTLITKTAYDNRNLAVSQTGYHTSVSNAHRTSYLTTDHDVLGRAYRTQAYGVNPSTGNTSNPQVSNIYYEPGNRVARNAPAGSALFIATTYNALGRPLKSYQAYEPSGFTAGSDPASVANAIVMEQQELSWSSGGTILGTTTRLRFDDATATGELQKPGTAPEARASYVATYSDGLGRLIATVDHGAKASATWVRSSTVPNRSDILLVTSQNYDDAGNLTVITDPASIETTRVYDNSDRLITHTENATGSSPAVRTTHYEYTDDGWLKKLKCDNATTGQQVTEWVYGVTNGGGSDLNSNRLVRVKYYPDTTGSGDWETFGYNRQQETTFFGNQAATNHVLNYDKLGRLYFDTVVNYGSGIDATVFAQGRFYNARGLPDRMMTYSSSYAILNQVYRVFNDFNQLVTEYQEHSGAVNVSTSSKVQYSYANGSANTIRPTGITYPDSTVITTAYTSAQSGFLSRPDQVKESSTVVASMRYLGLRTLIGQKYDAASDTELTYENGGTGDAGDKYTGLDRFGRLVETIWENGGGTVVVSSYGRNRMGGVTWRRDDQAHSLSAPVITQDNYYWYDGLQQVTRHDRGNLTPSGGPYTGIDPATRQQQEDFTFDETGNWPSYQSSSPSLAQTRTHNKGNEITALTNPASVIQPAYDPAGNMTTIPKPDDWTTAFACKWDAWNRLVEVKQGSSVVATYAYDRLSRRTKKTVAGITTDIYYNKQWRAVEDRVSSSVTAQYTWSPSNRWTLIRRKRSVSGTLNETRFCLRDNLDPVAIIDSSGVVGERYGYEAFGNARIMDASFVTISSSAVDWNWLFHGEFLDAETDLYNYGYRYYHTKIGRWISRDPVKKGSPVNLYNFVKNNSTNQIDFVGLLVNEVCAEACKAAAELMAAGTEIADAGAALATGAVASVGGTVALVLAATTCSCGTGDEELYYPEPLPEPRPEPDPEPRPEPRPPKPKNDDDDDDCPCEFLNRKDGSDFAFGNDICSYDCGGEECYFIPWGEAKCPGEPGGAPLTKNLLDCP